MYTKCQHEGVSLSVYSLSLLVIDMMLLLVDYVCTIYIMYIEENGLAYRFIV